MALTILIINLLKIKQRKDFMSDDIKSKIKKILQTIWVLMKKATEEASFIDDLGADSLDTVELVMALKKSSDLRSQQ